MPDTTSALAEIKISELPVADRANESDLLEASQVEGTGFVSRSITLDQVASVVADSDRLAETIEEAIDDIPPLTWDNITGKPVTFPPTVPIPYSNISGTPTIPTTLPPSGAAGGALTGSYPNPTLVGGPLSNYALSSSIPTTLPPNGAAGGDLAGSYPNPAIKPSVTNGQVLTTVAGVAAWAASGGGPPIGAAGGALAGTYPNPTLATAYLPLAGGTLTGTLNGTVGNFSGAVNGSVGTFSNSIVINNGAAAAALTINGTGATTGIVYTALGGNNIGMYYASGLPSIRVDASNFQLPTVITGSTAPPRAFRLTMGVAGPSNWGLQCDDGTTAFTMYADGVSDQRIKKDIIDTSIDALAVINAIPVRQYSIRSEYVTATQATYDNGVPIEPRPKSDHAVAIGLVTQEVSSLIPDMVSVATRHPDLPSNPYIPEDLQHIVLDRAVPHLIRAIQQLTARVAELEGKA